MNVTAESGRPRKRVCFVATVSFAVRWYASPFLTALADEYEFTVVASGRRDALGPELADRVRYIEVPIARPISLGRDLSALAAIWRLCRRERFDGIHSMMPKAGLLAMVAGRLAHVPVRIHTFTGQVWAAKFGVKRRVLRAVDRVLVRNATAILTDSRSQRTFLIDEHVASPGRVEVLGDGSVCGVDLARFRPDESARRRIRAQFGIAAEDVVFLFVGRLIRDKGIADLVQAFDAAASQFARIHLCVVGPDEDHLGPLVDGLGARLPGRVHRAGFSDRPEDYMAAADVLCLPSYREGFGSVVIEAAAAGLPAIASKIYGLVDAVEDGVSGVLHEPGDVVRLTDAISRFAGDAALRQTMGAAARRRATDKFSQARMTDAWREYYRAAFGAGAIV